MNLTLLLQLADQYGPAVLQLLLGGGIAFACLCRSRVTDNDTNWRVTTQLNILFGCSLLSLTVPPRVGAVFMSAGMLAFLLLSSYRWTTSNSALITALHSEKSAS